MQLALGRRWVLDLQFSVALTKQAERACDSARASMQRAAGDPNADWRWERDNVAGTMLSSWEKGAWNNATSPGIRH